MRCHNIKQKQKQKQFGCQAIDAFSSASVSFHLTSILPRISYTARIVLFIFIHYFSQFTCYNLYSTLNYIQSYPEIENTDANKMVRQDNYLMKM